MDGDSPLTNDCGVQYFDLSMMAPDCTFLIYGKRGSGKTVLLQNIMAHMAPHFSFGVAFAPTYDSIKMFEESIPKVFVSRPNVLYLEQFCKLAKEESEMAKEKGETPRRSFILCDDCAARAKTPKDDFYKSAPMEETFLNGRHDDIMCGVITQHIHKAPTYMRGNSDYVFVYYDSNRKNQDKIYDYWCGMMSKKEFKEVYEMCTENYGCLVIDLKQAATSRDWHNCIFWLRADKKIPPFRMCDNDFFKLTDAVFETSRVVKPAGPYIKRLGPDGKVFSQPTASIISKNQLPTVPKFDLPYDKNKKAPGRATHMAAHRPVARVAIHDDDDNDDDDNGDDDDDVEFIEEPGGHRAWPRRA